MSVLALHLGLLAAQLVNLALLGAWLALAVAALRRLGREELAGGLRLVWALLILFVPVAGAAAFLLAHPTPAAGRR
ncbi:MAG TPA: PLDc N-terminal domain-containing protein [Herpetosiphonaceae bacterium]